MIAHQLGKNSKEDNMNYALLVEVIRSGQLSTRQIEGHLCGDLNFAKYYRKVVQLGKLNERK